MTLVRLEPAALWSRVKHSTTEPLCSPLIVLLFVLEILKKKSSENDQSISECFFFVPQTLNLKQKSHKSTNKKIWPKQDTLCSSQYWTIVSTQEMYQHDSTIVDWGVKHQHKPITVKTLHTITLYNRIFNIQHKYAGNRSGSIKIPSL